jgi:hypothetical protein
MMITIRRPQPQWTWREGPKYENKTIMRMKTMIKINRRWLKDHEDYDN